MSPGNLSSRRCRKASEHPQLYPKTSPRLFQCPLQGWKKGSRVTVGSSTHLGKAGQTRQRNFFCQWPFTGKKHHCPVTCSGAGSCCMPHHPYPDYASSNGEKSPFLAPCQAANRQAGVALDTAGRRCPDTELTPWCSWRVLSDTHE